MTSIYSLYPVFLLVESILAFIIALIIIKKDSQYYLNQLFSLIVFCFGNYFFWECIMYLPYPPSHELANIYRDISLGAAILSAYLFFLASLLLWYGVENINKGLVAISAVIAAAVIIMANMTDWVLPITTEVSFANTPGIGIFLVYGTPVIFISLGAAIFLKVYAASDRDTREKIRLLLAGIAFITAAVVFFGISGQIGLVNVLGDINGLIGSIGYSIGLLFLLGAFWKT